MELSGLSEPVVNVDPEGRRVEVFVNEGEWFKKILPSVVSDLNHLAKLISKKANDESFFIDVNNYRKERSRIIVELAKAAAKKASIEKEPVKLPVMNAYERRLVHVELAVHPEVKTESEGEGRDRCVVIKPI
ncbi:MAG TPA: R3H domain-containing nucleic acid-binding protein [Candidatus Paceibacterota bacterium]